jgi:flagellar FliJ protein
MAFHFSLGTVLRVRGIVEEQEERLLQKILSEFSQTHEALVRTNAEIEETDASRRASVFTPYVGHNLHASYGEVERLKQRRKDLEGRVEQLDQLREKQLKVYEAARRNREMLTDMREEKLSVYESDIARNEQKTLDDNYVARMARA